MMVKRVGASIIFMGDLMLWSVITFIMMSPLDFANLSISHQPLYINQKYQVADLRQVGASKRQGVSIKID
jgi:hypothetical protein